MSSKVYPDAASALEGVLFDGMTIMSGGFGLSGNPENLIPALKDAGIKDLTVISNNCGADGFGLWDRGLAAQRYTKLLGRFARLTLRDSRDGYLRYLPRVAALLTDALDAEPLLWPIRDHLLKILPDWQSPPPDDPAALRRKVAGA